MNESGAPFLADILIVDDTLANLQLLINMLKQRGYKVRPVTSGRIALQAARSMPPDLILLDINMPGMDGYEVCRRLKSDQRLKAIPVIFVSAMNEMLDKVRAFSSGGEDYVSKPFQYEEVQARIETQLRLRRMQFELEQHNRHLEQLVAEKVNEISNSQMAMIFALAKLAESRDEDTGAHIERVQFYCRIIAERIIRGQDRDMSIDETFIHNLFHAAPLHDIGKVGVPDVILLKPGGLNDREFELMKMHTLQGAKTLEAVHEQYPGNAFIQMGIQIARSHHERWDGQGYPDGLRGDEIPLSARILAVADSYDAIRSKRPYKKAMNHEEAKEILQGRAGTQFDPRIVRIFFEVEEIFRKYHEEHSG